MSVTKTVHSQTAPGPLELPPVVGTAGMVRPPDLSSHPRAPTWLEALECFSNSGKELCQALLPGPIPRWSTHAEGLHCRTCLGGMALSAAGQGPQLPVQAQAPPCCSR